MKIISLSRKIGASLARRSHASEIRSEVLRFEKPVQLDFSGVTLISYSFAEEFFGRLAEEFGPDIFKTRILIKNVRPENQAVINAAINKRSKTPLVA